MLPLVRAVAALFDMKCYKWIPKHWKWADVWGKKYVWKAIGVKLRKRRCYLARLSKVRMCMCVRVCVRACVCVRMCACVCVRVFACVYASSIRAHVS